VRSMNRAWPTRSTFGSQRICPSRMMFIASYPLSRSRGETYRALLPACRHTQPGQYFALNLPRLYKAPNYGLWIVISSYIYGRIPTEFNILGRCSITVPHEYYDGQGNGSPEENVPFGRGCKGTATVRKVAKHGSPVLGVATK
jgi:hypothetical protein